MEDECKDVVEVAKFIKTSSSDYFYENSRVDPKQSFSVEMSFEHFIQRDKDPWIDSCQLSSRGFRFNVNSSVMLCFYRL